MIRREEVFPMGQITKTHGVKGELVINITDDSFDRVDAEYLVLDIDGLLVPFFMEEYRFKSDTSVLVTFEDIESSEAASVLTGVDVYFPKALVADLPPEEMSLAHLAGFEAYDVEHGLLGTITGIDDSTANVLFTIEDSKGEELMVPAHDDFVEQLDFDNRKVVFRLPDGMLSLDSVETFD